MWQGYPGQDSWERETNVAGARGAVKDFWAALQEPMRLKAGPWPLAHINSNQEVLKSPRTPPKTMKPSEK